MDSELWENHAKIIDESLMVLGGYESDGTPIYVGRSQFLNNIIPSNATFKGSTKIFQFSYMGRAHSTMNCELLVNTGFKWVDFNPPLDKIPTNAVNAGRTENGAKLYIGRVFVDGALIPGHVVSYDKILYYLNNGNEIGHYEPYQILVVDNDDQIPINLPETSRKINVMAPRTAPTTKSIAPLSTCSICLEENIKIMGIFMGCGHACLCEGCIPRVNAQKNFHGKINCPICRKESSLAIKIFYV